MTRAKDISKIVTDADLSGTLDVTGAVTTGGNVGINESNPSSSLHIYGSTPKITLEHSNENGTAQIYTQSQSGIILDADPDNTDNGTPIQLKTDGKARLLVEDSGDISFYEDTGTTPKLFWDASAECLNVGTPTSAGRLHVNVDAASDYPVRFVNSSSTGYGLSVTAGNNNTSIARFKDYAGNDRVHILGNGNVGIGTSSPDTNLDIERSSNDTGGIKVQNTNNSQSNAVAQVEISGGDNAYANLLLECNSTNHSIRQDGSGNLKFINASTEHMRIDSAGNVTIQPAGTTTRSFNEMVAIKKDQSGTTRLSVRNDSANAAASAGIVMSGLGNSWAVECGSSAKNANALTFAVDATAATPAVKMRLNTDGRFWVGQAVGTTLGGNGAEAVTGIMHHSTLQNSYTVIQANGSNNPLYVANGPNKTGSGLIHFGVNGSNVGSISSNGSITTYGTSSDYRLKENVEYDFDASTRLKQLKPARFNFIADADTTVDGFLAHEVQDIIPEAITGTKDAVENIGTITDQDNNVIEENVTEPSELPEGQTWTQTGTQPVYQGIDQAKLVPLLVKSLQEALTEIDSLKARLDDAGL
jgi:hypothetical protein